MGEESKMRAALECLLDDARRARHHRDRRNSGGQHVGTGGILTNCGYGALIHIERLCAEALEVPCPSE